MLDASLAERLLVAACEKPIAALRYSRAASVAEQGSEGPAIERANEWTLVLRHPAGALRRKCQCRMDTAIALHERIRDDGEENRLEAGTVQIQAVAHDFHSFPELATRFAAVRAGKTAKNGGDASTARGASHESYPCCQPPSWKRAEGDIDHVGVMGKNITRVSEG